MVYTPRDLILGGQDRPGTSTIQVKSRFMRTVKKEKNFPLPFSALLAGLRIKLSRDRITGENQI